MAGRGMGIATKGGGAVESGPRNKMLSETSKTTGPVMMAKGGEAKKKPKGMMGGGMMAKGMMAGGMMAKGMMAGGPVKRAAGSDSKGEQVYEVLGRRVTKEQYDEAGKEMARPKSKVEEEMDTFGQGAKDRAKERAQKKPKGMMAGGMMSKGYAAGGAAMKKKGFARGGKVS